MLIVTVAQANAALAKALSSQKPSALKVGSRVSYKAQGKVSRLEGKTGWQQGVVKKIAGSEVHILPDYRVGVAGPTRNMLTVVDKKNVRSF